MNFCLFAISRKPLGAPTRNLTGCIDIQRGIKWKKKLPPSPKGSPPERGDLLPPRMISRLADQISPKFGQHTATVSATYLFEKKSIFAINEGAVGGQILEFYKKKIFSQFSTFFLFFAQHF